MKPNQWQQQRAMGGAWLRRQKELEDERRSFNERQRREREQHRRAAQGREGAAASPQTVASIMPLDPAERLPPRFSFWRGLGYVVLLQVLLSGVVFLFGEPPVKLAGVVLLAVGLLGWRALRRRARRAAGKPRLVGECRGVTQQMEGGGNQNIQVLSFRVERYDGDGNRLPPVPVEMRGGRVTGSVREGDHVEIRARLRGDGVMRPRALRNLTTRSKVRTRKRKFWADVVYLIFLFSFLFALVALVVSAISNAT